MKLEEGLKKLDNIANTLENDEVSLDDSIKLFEESVSVAKECLEMLEQGKGKLVVVKKELDKIVEENLDD